jgi:hypothetical protein
LAEHLGVSQSAVSRIWRALGLQPHNSEAFKLSPAPAFIVKVRDVVGLYLNPPDRAPVLFVDERPHIQRDLFAALDVKAGMVIGELRYRHRSVEFRSSAMRGVATPLRIWSCT